MAFPSPCRQPYSRFDRKGWQVETVEVKWQQRERLWRRRQANVETKGAIREEDRVGCSGKSRRPTLRKKLWECRCLAEHGRVPRSKQKAAQTRVFVGIKRKWQMVKGHQCVLVRIISPKKSDWNPWFLRFVASWSNRWGRYDVGLGALGVADGLCLYPMVWFCVWIRLLPS